MEKMTDKDIINTLNCHQNRKWVLGECNGEFVRVGDVIDLINRQKVENKALKHYYDECMKDLKNAHTELERLKAKIKTRVIYYLDTNEENGVVYIPKFELDNLVKEMTEGSEC